MYFANVAGSIALVLFTAIMFLLVPWKRVQQLLALGALLGLIFGIANYYIMQNVVNAWSYQLVDLYSVRHVPVVLTLAWIPYKIIFIHLLTQYNDSPPLVALLFLTAAAVPTMFQFLLKVNGMVIAAQWPWWLDFFNALVIYIFLYFLYRIFLQRYQPLNS
jgi:hypothetical protein